MLFTTKTIPVSRLLLDIGNYRYDSSVSQNDAIKKLFDLGPEHMVRLCRDIFENGLDPSQRLIVTPSENKYIVREGNRRMASIMCLIEPTRAPEKYRGKIQQIVDSGKGSIPSEVDCSVFKKEEDTFKWVELRHTGENGGVGVYGWDSEQQARFKAKTGGKKDLTLQLSEWLAEKDPRLHDKLKKASWTNIKRLMDDPAVRSALGFDCVESELMTSVSESAIRKSIGRILNDFSTPVDEGGKDVNAIRKKEDREAYVSEIRSDLPKQRDKLPTLVKVGSQLPASAKKAPKITIPKTQQHLIERGFNFSCKNPRIMDIIRELKKLKVSDYTNACSMLLRALIDMSTYYYGKAEGLGLRGGAGNVNADFTTVIQHMEADNHLSKTEARAVRKTLVSGSKDSILQYDTLHQCVHNKDFFPTSTNLIAIFNNVKPYLEVIGTCGK